MLFTHGMHDTDSLVVSCCWLTQLMMPIVEGKYMAYIESVVFFFLLGKSAQQERLNLGNIPIPHSREVLIRICLELHHQVYPPPCSVMSLHPRAPSFLVTPYQTCQHLTSCSPPLPLPPPLSLSLVGGQPWHAGVDGGRLRRLALHGGGR